MGENKIDDKIKKMLAKQCIGRFNSFFKADFTEGQLIEIINYMFDLVESISMNPTMLDYIDNIEHFKSQFEKCIYQLINYNNVNYKTTDSHRAAQGEAKIASKDLLLSMEKYIKCIYYDLKSTNPDKEYRITLRNEFKKNFSSQKGAIGPDLDRFIQFTVENRNDYAHFNAAKMNYEGIEILEAYETLITWLVYAKIHMELKPYKKNN